MDSFVDRTLRVRVFPHTEYAVYFGRVILRQRRGRWK